MLGAHILFQLCRKSHKVIALKRKHSNTGLVLKIFSYYTDEPEQLFKKIQWENCDLNTPSCLQKYINKGDTVIHAAALVSFNKKDKEKIKQVNIDGTKALVNACLLKNAGKLCHISSIAALSSADKTGKITEKLGEIDPGRSEYSKSKFYSELEVWRGIAEGLNAVILNPSVILGPGNWSQGSSALFDTVYKSNKYYTTGVTGFTDVTDVAEIAVLFAENDLHGKRYIINSENISYKDLFQLMAKYLKVSPPKKEASPGLLKFIGILESVYKKITGGTPKLTKETIKAAASKSYYSNAALTNELNYRFLSIKESIEKNANLYLADL